MLNKDEYYQVILDGLSRYLDSPFAADVLRTLIRHPDPDFAHALNKNQVASKAWLTRELRDAVGARLGIVYVLGGWYGVLPAMLLDTAGLSIERVVSLDIDPKCEAVATTLNARHADAGRFQAVTADMLDVDYAAPADGLPRPAVVINTSCEHVERFGDWFGRLPKGLLLALQSNDMFGEEGHVNCVADLDAFKAHAPLAETFYAGALPRKRYTRFMLIGRK